MGHKAGTHLLDGDQLLDGGVELLVVRLRGALAPRAVEVRPLFLDKTKHQLTPCAVQ